MNFISILLSLNTMIIFLFKREWLLASRSYIILLGINGLLFVLGILLPRVIYDPREIITLLKAPLISQVMFFVLHMIFRYLFRRTPIDTFWSMDSTLFKDGVFNALFWVFGILIPLFLVYRGII